METIQEEKDYTCFLTEEETQLLEKHPNCMDYKLTDQQRKFMDEHGYLVLEGLIEPQLCDAIVHESFNRARSLFGLEKDDEDSWKIVPFHGIVDVWNAPSLYTLRQHPKIYSVFAQLLKTWKLAVSIDRVCIKPPCRDKDATNENLSVHTDLNYWASSPSKPVFQGGLCLEDCPIGGGGFFCIPGMHKSAAVMKYKKEYEEGKFTDGRLQKPPSPSKVFLNFLDTELAKAKLIEIPLKKGDFVIWNSCLPHNGGVNTLPNHWRIHTYVRFLALDGPTVDAHSKQFAIEYQKMTLECLKTGKKPERYSTGNTVKSSSSKDAEVGMHKTPTLTPLGKCIFGITSWNMEETNKNNRKKNRVQGAWK